MTSLNTLTADDLAGRADIAAAPAWLRDRRLDAAKRFSDQAWPNSRTDEFWRGTRFDRLPVDLDLAAPAGLTVLLPDGASDRVVAIDLAEAAASERWGALVRTHLGSLTTTGDGSGADEDRTVTASDAAWTDGVFVHVPAEVEVGGQITVRCHLAAAGTHLPRVLVVLGHHASATVVIEHTSAEGITSTLVDEVVEAVLEDSAILDLVSLQEWRGDVDHLSLQKAAVHRGATLRHLSVTIGGRIVRLRPEVDLLGQGASCFPLGVYFADAGQHFDLQPTVRHIAARAVSDVLYKGAVQGKAAHAIFRGNVFVGHDAVGTNTNQTNRTLVLTEGAKADSTPFLEIFCSDVVAGHGSATGQLDANHLYYLQARGIPRAEALKLIVMGFFRDVLDHIDLPDVEARTLAHLEREIEVADLDAIRTTMAAPLAIDPDGRG